jgi:hypothetical protein
MKLPSKKRIAVAAFTIAALGVLALVGVLVAVRTTHRPKVTISVDDLAEMKTLVHKYLNERNRVAVSHDPQSNPNVAGAPVIDPSEMSPELAARQKEDVEKSRASVNPGCWDDFATFLRVLDIRGAGDDVVLVLRIITFYQVVDPYSDPFYSSEGYDLYCTFAQEGNRWILTDAKLDSAGTMPPVTEPSVKPNEKGSSRVLSKWPGYMERIPEKIKRLDEAATVKITNKWALDEKTVEGLQQK